MPMLNIQYLVPMSRNKQSGWSDGFWWSLDKSELGILQVLDLGSEGCRAGTHVVCCMCCECVSEVFFPLPHIVFPVDNWKRDPSWRRTKHKTKSNSRDMIFVFGSESELGIESSMKLQHQGEIPSLNQEKYKAYLRWAGLTNVFLPALFPPTETAVQLRPLPLAQSSSLSYQSSSIGGGLATQQGFIVEFLRAILCKRCSNIII